MSHEWQDYEFLFHLVGYLDDIEKKLQDAVENFGFPVTQCLSLLEEMENCYGGFQELIEYVRNGFEWGEE